jgi:hypothetical protein
MKADMKEADFHPLGQGHRGHFEEICADTRSGFEDAIDLVLLHNERDVRGNQPRRKLNPLIVLLAVAAWERFVVDVQALGSVEWRGPGMHRKANRAAYLDSATKVLGPLSGGALPSGWRIRAFGGWRGKSPQGAVLLDCAAADQQEELERDIEAWINLRNKVAHRCMPQDRDPYWVSDADAHTIQAGEARAGLAELLQLTDQSIVGIATAAGYGDTGRFRLPASWFAAEPPAGFRGIDRPGALWGGHALYRP